MARPEGVGAAPEAAPPVDAEVHLRWMAFAVAALLAVELVAAALVAELLVAAPLLVVAMVMG